MPEEPEAGHEDLSFDKALVRLEDLATRLEQGDIPLEDALAVYEQAVKLFAHCRRRLDGMEQKIEQLTENLDGTLDIEPMSASEEDPDDG